MNLVRNHFAVVLRSPDDPAAPEPVADPAVIAEPVATALDPAPEPVADLTPPAPPAPAMVPLRVMQERVGEETNKRQAAEEAARQASERAQSFEEIVKRLQADPAKPADPANPRPIEPSRAAPPADQMAVEQKAAQLVLQRDLQAVSEAGGREFGAKWSDAIGILNACGANSTEFVASVMEIDPTKTHEIMFQIAQDPEKAAALARMTPGRRSSEITRMIMAQSADPKPAADAKPDPKADPKPAAAVSRAPAPKPAIAPHAAAPDVDPTTPEGNDKMDDAAWEQWYNNKYLKRTA